MPDMTTDSRLLTRIKEYATWRWKCEGGWKEFIVLAFPLIMTTASWSLQQFIDRVFLSWYSREAVAAAMPAGILNFALMSLWIGTAGYVDVFVSQYYGARRYNRIGMVLWQGVYLALISGAGISLLYVFAKPLFDLIGHEPIVRTQEVAYFKVLSLGAIPVLISTVCAGFYAGRGKTWTIMWVNAAGTLVNIVFDYFLIFGKMGFPQMGITGAGIASVMSACTCCLLYLGMISRKKYRETYGILSGWRYDGAFMRRIIRYGLPNGIQFFIDMIGFTAFIMIIGYVGTDYLAASTIAFNINTIAFMPMIGCGIAVSVMIGQYLGQNKPEIAERAAYSGFGIVFGYMSFIALLFMVVPKLFIAPFAHGAGGYDFDAVSRIVIILLRFVAVYSLFDTMTVLFAAAIKGAGDTRFSMYMVVFLTVAVLVFPSVLAVKLFHAGIYTLWVIGTLYVSVMGIVFFLRFRSGKWKSMRVIEPLEDMHDTDSIGSI